MKNYIKLLGSQILLCVFLCNVIFAEENKTSFLKKIDLNVSSAFEFNSSNTTQNNGSIKGGIQLLFADFDFRLFKDVSKTQFSDGANVFFEKVKNVKDLQYGASFSTKRFLPLPITVKAGTLNPSGSFSLFTTPTLSSSNISPFSKTITYKKSVTSDLPSQSDTTKRNFSSYIDIRFPKMKKQFVDGSASFLYLIDGTMSFSTEFSFALPYSSRIGGSATWGRFFPSKKTFKQKWYNSFVTSAFFEVPFLESIFTVNIYEQQNSKYKLTFRSENKLSIYDFSLIASSFFVRENNITNTKGNAINTLWQLKLVPQYVFKFDAKRKPSITIGAVSFIQQNYAKKENYNKLKSEAGISYKDKYISTSITFSENNLQFSKTKKINLYDGEYATTLQYSQKISNFKIGGEAVVSFSKKETTEKLKLDFATSGNKIKTDSSITVSFSQPKETNSKNKTKAEAKNKIDASLSFSLSYITKLLNCTFKVEAKNIF